MLVADAWGSGVVISKDGLVLTEATLVASGSGIEIVTATGKKGRATLVRADAASGVALIRVTGVTLDPLPMNLSPLSAGEAVTAIGTPFHSALSFSVSPGRVATTGAESATTDVSTSRGNAGGPVIDSRARGRGIVVWRGGSAESAPAIVIPAGIAFQALGLGYADADRP